MSVVGHAAAGSFACAIMGATTAATPAVPVQAGNYPMFLYDANGTEVAATYRTLPACRLLRLQPPLKCPWFTGTSLSGLALLKYTPLAPVSVDLTIRPAPSKSFNADVFQGDLALFLNCSVFQVFTFCNTLFYVITQRPHQISLRSIVTSTRALVPKYVHLPELPAQRPLYRAAGDVSLTVTFAESPFLAANIAPAVLAQVSCSRVRRLLQL